MDEAAQVEFIVNRVLANREAGMDLRAQAVLMRASHHSSQLEVELTRRNIPFIKFGGLKFLEAAHIKDVISVLRWADNPRDQVAALRVLKLLPGMGAAAARRAFGLLDGSKQGFDALSAFKPPVAAADGWSTLTALMHALAGSVSTSSVGFKPKFRQRNTANAYPARTFRNPQFRLLATIPAVRRRVVAVAWVR